MQIGDKKHCTKTDGASRRANTVKYFLIDQQPENQVCQSMFLTTFAISEKKARVILQKKSTSNTSIALGDKRGKHGQQRKVPEEDVNRIKRHIESFPSYESHYCRTKSSKKYLSPSLTISQMYCMYVDKCRAENITPTKDHMYRKVFNENFNLSFHPPTKDTCDKCDSIKASLKTANEEEKKILESQKESHLAKADAVYHQKRLDKEHAEQSDDCIMATFDLQKVLPCPLLRTGIAYYKRQLAVYNLTVYETTKNGSKAYCFMWNETIAGRGSQEIGSCLWKWIEGLSSEIKDVRLYSDCCGGQNRNYPLSTMLMHLASSRNIKITHTYFQPGHSHMEADTIHAIIEKHKKTTMPEIEIPRDWITTVKSIHRKEKLNVVAMESTDFRSVKHLFSNNILINRNKNEDGDPMGWLKIRRIYYGKNIGKMEYVTSIMGDCTDERKTFSVLRRDVRGRNVSWTFPQLHQETLPISEKKKKDLFDLLPLTSRDSRKFYTDLKITDDASADTEYL